MRTIGATPTRPLETLGISEIEERLYEWLLTHSGANLAEIQQALRLPSAVVRRTLDGIEAKGLITHTPERSRRYLAAAPDISLQALALRREEELRRAQGVIRQLQERAAASRGSDERQSMVELITSAEAERQAFEQMNRTARREIVSLLRPPIRVSRLAATQDYETQRRALGRGVRYRVIVDANYLDLPGAVQRTREDVASGEEIKAVAELPSKMVLVDRRIALLPLSLEQAQGPVLLVRSSALLDTLYALFEILWERAAPLSLSAGEQLETGASGSHFSAADRDLVTFLAAGLNDKKIASELGVSTRTLHRRLGEVSRLLGARTRFQTGWLAALQLIGSRGGAGSKSSRRRKS